MLSGRFPAIVMASRAAAATASTATRTAMGAKKNVHIENWASFRENCEHVFQVSLKNLGIFAVAGVAVPYGIYQAIINEQVRLGACFCRCGHEWRGRQCGWWGAGVAGRGAPGV